MYGGNESGDNAAYKPSWAYTFFGCHCRLHTKHVAYFDTNSYLQCLAPNVCNKLLITHILWKCEYKTQNNKHKHTCNVPC